MGFFDRDVDNSLDRMFDFNRDEVLDPIEQGAEFDFLMQDGDSEAKEEDTGLDSDDFDDF